MKNNAYDGLLATPGWGFVPLPHAGPITRYKRYLRWWWFYRCRHKHRERIDTITGPIRKCKGCGKVYD